MDPKVLEAQQWVNATYGGVTGFNKAPENGKTGWATVYALIRALQHELGITALSDNFGPGTMAALTAHGDIAEGETNTNIVKILQSGCYCKGYNPGGITGEFGPATQQAIHDLKRDAGLGESTPVTVPAKVFKGLLNMDAYVLVSSGKPAARAIQQWLNSRYLARKNFFLIPCDGIFSRDVQKALYLAIQFELGFSDDGATGVFGPATRAGLKNHPLTEGSADSIFVQIFSAAMIVNDVRLGDNTVYSNFTSVFDANLTTAVRALQFFSQLPVNGNADYATWCQVLVSSGDPDRPGTALDCRTTITDARAQALLTAGYRVVGRYLDSVLDGPTSKKIQPGELDTIFRNGLKVFPISQYSNGAAADFTYDKGYKEATSAHVAAVKHGFNTGTVIYFAVDFDATQADVDAAIIPYFQGVIAALADKGNRYKHGVYGSRNVCTQVTKRTGAKWSFVSGMSYAYSGNMGFPLPENWAFNQVQTLTVGSGDGTIEIDKNIYRTGTDPAVSSVNDPDVALADIRRGRTPGPAFWNKLRHWRSW